MFPANPILALGVAVVSYLVIRFVCRTSLLFLIRKWLRSVEDWCHVYQFYRVPQFNEHLQENQLYRKVYAYLNSLTSVEDSDFASLFSGSKSNEIKLFVDENQAVVDNFLSTRVYWTNEKREGGGSRALILKIRRSDKRRILRPYLQHIHQVFDEIEQRGKEVNLYINAAATAPEVTGRWRSVPFTHPATIDAVAMDTDLKNKLKSDLETFLKSKQYYHRLGRVWKRSYLLCGASGTGKSSFVAGMARFLSYDVYDIDLSRVSDDADLKMLLLQTTNKSLIVIEDLDRYFSDKSKSTAVSLSGILNFMDGIFSCCGEERVTVFTMNGKDLIDPAVLRPGRIDVHVHFPLCDFSAFRTLANSYLGLKEHKLFPQVEEVFQTGASLSPAEIREIMISNRASPSRAIKSVITALQTNGNRVGSGMGPRLSGSTSRRVLNESGESEPFFSREVKEFKKLYGLLKMRSGSRKSSLDLDASDMENSRHGTC